KDALRRFSRLLTAGAGAAAPAQGGAEPTVGSAFNKVYSAPLLPGCAPPRLDQPLERLAQLGILQLRQLDRFPCRCRAWHCAQFRPLAPAEPSLHKSQLTHGVVAQPLGHARENL